MPSPFLLTKRGLFLLLFTAEPAENAEKELAIDVSVSFEFKIHLCGLCVLCGECFDSQKGGGGEDGYGKRHV